MKKKTVRCIKTKLQAKAGKQTRKAEEITTQDAHRYPEGETSNFQTFAMNLNIGWWCGRDTLKGKARVTWYAPSHGALLTISSSPLHAYVPWPTRALKTDTSEPEVDSALEPSCVGKREVGNKVEEGDEERDWQMEVEGEKIQEEDQKVEGNDQEDRQGEI
ncbi:hypothetical protein E2C01_033606 [Portunus trituberculatus]|uniref:Uncharacterized protein n=1 Tax=Portunus trituberculatus TaxID=210409 RepID=A0A5B7F4N7_PORTR|nr:hypothetical protein [Portunus trituberculatus]